MKKLRYALYFFSGILVLIILTLIADRFTCYGEMCEFPFLLAIEEIFLIILIPFLVVKAYLSYKKTDTEKALRYRWVYILVAFLPLIVLVLFWYLVILLGL